MKTFLYQERIAKRILWARNISTQDSYKFVLDSEEQNLSDTTFTAICDNLIFEE